MPRSSGIAVVFLALASLLWPRARDVELWPAFALGWCDAPLAPLFVPDAPAHDWVVDAADRRVAEATFAAYVEAVLGRRLAPVTAATVLERDRARGRMVVRLRAGVGEVGKAVVHRDALVGVVAERRGDDLVVDVLGNPRVGPIAGEWRVGEQAPTVHFLAQADGGELRIASRSARVNPPAEQVAYTRDVGALGDALPGGLVLGRVAGTRRADAPGGAAVDLRERSLELERVLDPWVLDVVAVEGAALDEPSPATRVDADPITVGPARQHGTPLLIRTDEDSRVGDMVVQAGVYVGAVEASAGAVARVDTRAPRGQLVVVDDDGAVTPCTAAADGWPPDWRPVPGDLVVTGVLGGAGVVVGWVDRVDADGFTVRRPPIDVTRRMEVRIP